MTDEAAPIISSMELSPEERTRIDAELDQLIKRAATTDKEIDDLIERIAQTKERLTRLQKRLLRYC
jgi:peptidoglycan hydrolase CwlO-like protein